jgi:chromosome condensin MukBEF ATPase and DNA-binding subunit MukB
MNFKMKSRFFIIISTIFLLAFPASAQGTDEQNEKAAKLYEEYMEINQRLQMIQQQALNDEIFLKRSQDFAGKVEAEMIKKDPTVQNKLEQRDSVIEEYQQAETEGSQEKIMAVQQKYQAIMQELQAHQNEAMQNEELLKEGEELEAALIQKMEEIDPEVPQLLAKLNQIGTELRSMDIQ